MNKLVLVVFLSVLSLNASAFNIYLAADGSDYSDGLSINSPIKTLSQAHSILEYAQPAEPVNIHIKPGVYSGQQSAWSFYNGYSVTFIGDPGDRPVFDGGGKNAFFSLNSATGLNTKLKFSYLKIQNYCYGLRLKGDRNSTYDSNSGNSLYGMYFYNIGGKYADCKWSSGAVVLVNSDNNKIENSHFVNIENNSHPSNIHAVYLAHYSSDNYIARNRFDNVSGDPIRVRDNSNYNQIFDNRFYNTGDAAYYSDWFCDPSVNTCTKPSPECRSYGNEFRGNDLYGTVSTFKKYGSDTSCGSLPVAWLKTSGNVKH